MSQRNSRAIESIKNISASSQEAYSNTDLGIQSYDEDTKNIMSSTFGVIKNNFMSFWYAIGLDPNVTNIYTQTMMDQNKAMTFNGNTYYPHPGVGNLHPYNESGHSSDGCFQFHTLG